MPTLNPNLAYKLPPARKAPVVSASLPEDWMSKLIQSIEGNLESAPSFDLADRLNEHVGGASTYGMKAQIMEGLSAIYPVMMDAKTSRDQKTSIAFKLIERVENCTAGFHDGVNSIVDGFESPQSLDDVLYRIRHDIVSKTANQTTDEVHGNNRFFTVAQIEGFGVRALNPGDVYSGHIPDATIHEKLTAAFNRDYRLFSILRGMEDQVRSELLKLEYTGEREAGYEPAVMDKFVNFLTTLFHDSPAVMKQREAIALQQEYEQRIQNFMRPMRQAVGEIISELKNQNFVDALITNSFPETLKPKYINGLDDDKKKRIAGIQDNYAQFIKSEDMQSLSARMNESTADRISPFQRVDDDDRLHLNWNQIRQAIWEGFRDKHYFTLTELEASALNGLIDNRLPFDVEQGENLSLSGSEVVALFSMQMLSDEKKEGLLRWYIVSAQDTPEHKLTSLAVIQDLGRQDKAIRAVEDTLESDIRALKQSVKEGWLNKLTSIFNYDELNLPRFLRQDKAFMLEAINGHPWVLKHASAALQADRDFVLAAVSQKGLALEYASAALIADREVVLAAVSQQGSALESASAALREDRQVVLAAVSRNGSALRYASAALQADAEVVLAAVSQEGSALRYASAALQADPEVVLAAVRQEGWALVFASAALREDREVVLAAVSQQGSALEYASDALQADREFVLAAVSQDGSALMFASAAWKEDREFVLAAVSQNEDAFQYASAALQQDSEILLATMPGFVESETQDAALNPHAIQIRIKQSLSSLKPTHLTADQMEGINEQLRILGRELKASSNVMEKSLKEEHITALKELKTLSQSMDVLSAIQQIEADDRFQRVEMLRSCSFPELKTPSI